MISEVLGIDSDYIIIALAVIMLLMLILLIVNTVIIIKLKKKYQVFMRGKSAKNLYILTSYDKNNKLFKCMN